MMTMVITDDENDDNDKGDDSRSYGGPATEVLSWQLCGFLFLETGSCDVAHTAFGLLGSSDPTFTASQVLELQACTTTPGSSRQLYTGISALF
jgi:hypothetical protein